MSQVRHMLRQSDSSKHTSADNLPYEKVGKNEPVCIADDVPFEIPESWEWVRLKNLAKKEIKRGKSPKYTVSSNIQVFAQKCNIKAGGIDMTLAKYLDDTVFPKYPEEECMRDSDIVINSTGNGTLGRIGMFHDSDRINENIIVPDSHVTVIRASEFLSADYIFYVLNYYQPYLEKSCSGSTNQTELKPAVISELFIPVPPVNEQTRIITKLIEALNLSKLYGEKEILLQKYNQDFPEQLKKSILQYAVEGKLVPQNPSDEPATVLLERIRAEKQKLIAEGKIKKDKHESVIFRRDNSHYEKLDGIERCIDNEIPFEIPETWAIVRLQSICKKITDGEHKTPRRVPNYCGFFLLSARNVRDGYISLNNVDYVDKVEYLNISKRCNPIKNDILISCSGSIGRCCIVDDDNKYVMVRSAAMVSPIQCNSSYIMYAIQSSVVQSQISERIKQAVQANLFQGAIRELLIPVPPLEEQLRIVNQIETILLTLKKL